MTSQERLHCLYYHQEMDRPAVIIRWWGYRDDPSYHDLYRLMIEQADWVEPWQASIDQDEMAKYFRRVEHVGERGIVVAHLGNNPGGAVVERFGSEEFALLSITDREMLHQLMQHELEEKLRLLDALLAHGVGPFFTICGQEMIAPPLHGRQDFFDFNVRYDRPLADCIHEAGGRLNVHCHGRLKAVIDGFPQLGADVLHCFEAPPMGDITPAEAKQALRGLVALEGNIQIADLYENSPEDIRAQTAALIRDCFTDHRGLAITPTASPFIPGRGQECYPQYLAMVETVLGG